jgi:UDP-GlcNAc:undecaprenyl-phosphate GlcNAc-1-phosphate transferase
VGTILAASLFGASAGFLRYNFSPATVFLGDAGSLSMGYLLAALSIMAAGNPSFQSLAAPAVVLGYPVFDITFVTLVRIRESRKIYQGGRDHSSHRLAACYASTGKTAGVIYLICLALGASGFLMGRVGKPAFSLAVVVLLASLLVVLGLRLHRVKSHLIS